MNTIFHPLTLSADAPIGILGGGVEGVATARYLQKQGMTHIEILDMNPIADLPEGVTGVFGDSYLTNLHRFHTLFRSPGIRPDIPPLLDAVQNGVRLSSALSLFMEVCPAPIIGITGTMGKGTACSILAAALTASEFTVHLGGNIGVNPLSFLDTITSADRVVLEISSFQAMDIARSPQLAGILKTTSEHLNWHTDTQEYRNAKAALLTHQKPTDIVVFNADSPGAAEIARHSRGVQLGYSLLTELPLGLFLQDEQFVLRLQDREQTLPLMSSQVSLSGRFNLENIAAALLLSICAGGDPEASCQAAEAFTGLPHRLERVVDYDSMVFFNDSYATRPEAAIGAISSFDAPLAVILGGSEKNTDFTELVQRVRTKSNIRSVQLIGQTAQRLFDQLHAETPPDFPVFICESLEEAMKQGVSSLAGSGVLLLSPACASFGMFANYKDRGEQFCRIAKRMCQST